MELPSQKFRVCPAVWNLGFLPVVEIFRHNPAVAEFVILPAIPQGKFSILSIHLSVQPL